MTFDVDPDQQRLNDGVVFINVPHEGQSLYVHRKHLDLPTECGHGTSNLVLCEDGSRSCVRCPSLEDVEIDSMTAFSSSIGVAP